MRYGIDNSRRTKHGALLDAEILAEVYSELNGGRQAALVLATGDIRVERPEFVVVQQRQQPLGPYLSDDERSLHARFVEGLGKNALWQSYVAAAERSAGSNTSDLQRSDLRKSA
jgi:DNA polymerase-3 subunit epsilon